MLDRTKSVTPNEAGTDPDDDWVEEWTNYVPDPIVISEERRQECREAFDRFLAEQFEEYGEPSPEEMARAEAWWGAIKEHMEKKAAGESPAQLLILGAEGEVQHYPLTLHSPSDGDGTMSDHKDPISLSPPLTEEEKAELEEEWADYVPDPIIISEERKQELREERERYIAELIEEFGEPTAEEMASAEAWWKPIKEHLTKNDTP